MRYAEVELWAAGVSARSCAALWRLRKVVSVYAAFGYHDVGGCDLSDIGRKRLQDDGWAAGLARVELCSSSAMLVGGLAERSRPRRFAAR